MGMRTCPSCKATYSAGETQCAACGAALAVDVDLELQDTMQQTRSAVMAAVAAPTPVPMSSTPGPVVRSGRGSNPPDPATGAATDIGAEPAAAAPATTFDSIVGATLAGRYEVTRKVGEGGMGAVYEARHAKIGKRVAIKVLLDKYVQKADVVARLQQEARMASSIGHENIVDITDFGETDDGRTFVVMEFLEGESLAGVIDREGALPPPRAVSITRQVASALGAAHDKGIIHRDVKPENIFIVRRGDKDFVKVVDFGISKAMKPAEPEDEDGTRRPGSSPRLTQTGMVLGTPLYMSPEQARGEDDLDHRIDIYALGIILYEMLTGEVPFHGTNYLNIISQVLSQDPRPPSRVRPDLGISPALEGVVAKAMAKDRAVRYPTMVLLDQDLAKIEAGVAVRAGTGTGEHERRRRLGQILAWAAGVSAVVVGVALVLPKVLKSDEPPVDTLRSPAASPTTAAKPRFEIPQPPQIVVTSQPQVHTIRAHVTSTPPGAEIWWDAVDKGTAPADLEIPYGGDQIALTLKLEGYDDATARFFPTADQELKVTLTKKKPPAPAPAVRKAPPPGGHAAGSGGATPDPTGGDIHKNPFDKSPARP
jgi:serine/threonine protein kinase